jgi:hypothetical protein
MIDGTLTPDEVVEDFLASLGLVVLDEYGPLPVMTKETIDAIGTMSVLVNRIAAPQDNPYQISLAHLALTTATILSMERGQFGCTAHVHAFLSAWREVLELRRAAGK